MGGSGKAGPVAPQPVQITFDPPPEDARAFARRLRVMAAVTTPGLRIKAEMEPATARDMAAVIEQALSTCDRLSAGDLMTRPDVEAAIDHAARLSAATFALDAEVRGRLVTAMSQLQIAVCMWCFFALGFYAGLPW